MSSPRPDPIPLTLGPRTLATAYPRRPPTKRQAEWSWRMAYADPTTGRRIFRELGRAPASAIPERLLAEFARIDPEAMATDTGGVRTVTDLLRVWYASLEGRSGEAALATATMNMYRQHCVHLRDLIGHARLKDLRQLHFEQVRDRMIHPDYRAAREAARTTPLGPKAGDNGYGARTINQTLSVAQIALAYAEKAGLDLPTRTLDPRAARITAKRGKKDTLDRYRAYTPTDQEVDTFYAGLRKRSGAVAHFVYVAWKTGGRAGEVGALRWADVVDEPDGAYVTLDGKTGRRRVAISPEVYAEVLRFRRTSDRPEDRMFSATYGRRASAHIVRALKLQGVPDGQQWTAHGLRRRWCKNLIEAGVPVSVYADQAGHSAAVALEHYARVSDRDRRAAAVRVNAHEDIHQWLADKGLSVAEAIGILQAHLDGRE